MNPQRSTAADERRIDLEAAEWLVRRDRGFTAADQDNFSQWLAQDPRHGEQFARHQASWKQFDLLAEWRPGHASEPNPDLLARLPKPRRWLAPRPLAAAAALAVLAGAGWWQLHPAGATAVPPAEVAQAYERRVLEDGSVVELNRGAAVVVEYSPRQRDLWLQSGEAQFTVAKNPARPFIVHAAGVGVKAVGTVFDVRVTSASVEVLVTEGRIEVRPPEGRAAAAPATLVAGQQASVRLDGEALPEVIPVSPEETVRMLAWKPALLDFDSAPLSEVVAAFNRHNRTQLEIADPAIGALPIVASFRSDNLDAFVRLLEVTGEVRVERRGPYEVVLHAVK